MELVQEWYGVIARNKQLALLLVLLVLGTAFVVITASILAPFYAAITLAYVMETAIQRLQRRGMRRSVALGFVYGIFIALLLSMFAVLPFLGKQLAQLVGQVPQFVARAQELIAQLPEKYPTIITADQIADMVNEARSKVLGSTNNLGKYLGGTVVGLVTLLVYVIIIPIMVFFLLKDKSRIFGWVEAFLPAHHELTAAVWRDVNRQLQNFVGGKVLQMGIVAVVSLIVFEIIGLSYAPLLAIVVGVAVLIPYIGAAAATVPVAAVALLEWGVSMQTGIAVGAYLIIHALDGNVLVPFLFSEAVAIHPVAIIVAVLFFGGVWGVWGVFFAIPLAVLVKAVISAWPTTRNPQIPANG